MVISQCPGQDKRFWKPDDIFESPCPECGAVIEFWKDDVRRRCRGCGATVANPRFDMGCAKWCLFAEQCLGAAGAGETEDAAGARLNVTGAKPQAAGGTPSPQPSPTRGEGVISKP